MNREPDKRLTLTGDLQTLLNAIPAYTWYAMPSGALTFVNKRSADYLGLSADHPMRLGVDIGGAWDSHIPMLHPDDHDETRRVWAHCIESGTAGEVSFRLRGADGIYRWFISRAEPTRAAGGSILYWTGINLEAEGQKRAEFYLKEGQRLAHSGSWAFDGAGFTYWSPELFELHGLKSDSKPPSIPEYLEVVHPDDREAMAASIKRNSEAHLEFDFTKRIVRPDGAVRHIRCVGIPTSDGRFIGTGVDVTEQEELTQALRTSEAQFRQILDLMPQLVAVFSANLDRLYINRTALDYLGLTHEEWVRRDANPKAYQEIYPDDAEILRSHMALAETDGASFEAEVRIEKSDGSYRWHVARYKSVRDAAGHVQRWFVACSDIDDRKRTEERLQLENAALRDEIAQASMFEDVIGSSEALRRVLAQIPRIAPSDSTVLILGETGTGKELIARAIHRHSQRAARAFIGVNCGAIPTSLIASELFGHEKGAFTGATHRRIGRFEAANGGTIFLDEIGDLPLDIQIALLRVLQEREIERVGGDKPIPIDVRILAATHRDLEQLVEEQKFRQDLYYRLNVVPLAMPPLRERVTDIPMLVEYFIARFGRKAGKTFTKIGKKTLDILTTYPWPGNVRELQNVIERAVTLADSEAFVIDEAWLKRSQPGLSQPGIALDGLLSGHEREAIEAALTQSYGRVSGPKGAAAILGVPTSTLDSKIKRLGIDRYKFKSRTD